jgi:outer membrane protein TolC
MQHGTTNYLEVLTARQSLLSAQLSLVEDKYNEIEGAINLYHALGGGME